jgi:SSS family solute:Na+ symporter
LADYAVVGRSYGSLIIFATMSASFIGGGFSTGNAQKVFLFGIANIIGLWGFSLKEILVALFVAPKMDRFPNAISVGDIMATAYGKVGRVITGLCALFLCAGIVGAQVGAMGIVFNVFYGIDRDWGILIGCGTVILYTTFGGMRAVVATDIVQFLIPPSACRSSSISVSTMSAAETPWSRQSRPTGSRSWAPIINGSG